MNHVIRLPLRRERVTALLLAVLALSAQPARAQNARAVQYPVLPRDLEIELALNAAPPQVRSGAAVLVYEPAGYISAQAGTNAFTCIVSRRGGDFFPVCWDVEGARTLLQVDLDDATLHASGKSNAEIDEAIAAGFKSGKYRAPTRTGVAYMLSPMRYKTDDSGHITRSNPLPHVMFYGPGLTDADIGGVRGSLLFMNKVGPDGMIIVPVGQKEREAILNDTQALTDRVEQQIGYTAPQSQTPKRN